MPEITLLDKNTIDKIAAGEVVDRPASVVKELVENAIDAQATAVTVEIKNGGISLIRITDNGYGIEQKQIRMAFKRHSTSKIRAVEDLLTISSLGFRGEALSSIASVARVELITKTSGEMSGSRYLIEGGEEKALEEIGAPGGTTFLVRDLFYNTPARRKFLKTAQTEAGYVSDLMERMALSHPDVSFKFINNGQVRLHTSGNANLKDIIYHIYGRDIAANILEIHREFPSFTVQGFIGKPVISRGNRHYESYFVNGRYVKSNIISKAIEDGYKGFMMQHKYPFTVLQISLSGDLVDVNVHPAKMELRFSNGEELYWNLLNEIQQVLKGKELIPQVSPEKEASRQIAKPDKGLPADKLSREEIKKAIPEPFETKRLDKIRKAVAKDSPYEPKYEQSQKTGMLRESTAFGQQDTKPQMVSNEIKADDTQTHSNRLVKLETDRMHPADDAPRQKEAGALSDTKVREQQKTIASESIEQKRERSDSAKEVRTDRQMDLPENEKKEKPKQMDLGDFLEETQGKKLLDEKSVPYHKIIGQLFDTYWLVEFQDQLYMIDQHAAHEKVLYERTMADYRKKEFTSQYVSPPIVLSLTMQEEVLMKKYMHQFEQLGFEIEPFGGKEYAIRAVPDNLYGLDGQELVIELMDGLGSISDKDAPELVMEKVASMSCKAAVKGNQKLSRAEIETLIGELLTLENPYHCPHGRPVIVSMSKYEIEKKFKRVL